MRSVPWRLRVLMIRSISVGVVAAVVVIMDGNMGPC